MRLETNDGAEAPPRALVELIHEQRGHLSPRQRLRGLHSVTLRAAWRRLPWRRPARWALSSAVAFGLLAGGIAAVLVARRGPRSLSYAIDDGRLDPKGLIEGDSGSGP